MEIRIPQINESGQVGQLMFLVDPFIYPALFSSKDSAQVIMPFLMAMPNSPFAPSNIRVAENDAGELIGVSCMLLGRDAKDTAMPSFAKFALECPAVLPPSCQDAYERYFSNLWLDATDGQAYIVSLATSPENREHGVGTALMRDMLSRAKATGCRSISLDVLADNERALELYRKLGFEVAGETSGYAWKSEPPKVFAMRQ